MPEAMDREGEVAKGRVRKPITFLTNGTIAILLIIVMLLSVVEGYKHAVVACPEGSLYSFTADDAIQWQLIYGLPAFLLINIQAYIATRGLQATGIRGMVFGLTVAIMWMFAWLYAGGFGGHDSSCY